MNLVKLSLVTLAGAFAFSCSQPAPKPTTNAVVNSATSIAISAGKPQSQNGTGANSEPKRRPIQAEAMAELDEPIADDIYATNCMICHKDTGKGGKVTINGKSLTADDLTSEKMKNHPDDELAKRISEGVPDEGMPAFKGKLSDDQIKSVVAHVRGLQSR